MGWLRGAVAGDVFVTRSSLMEMDNGNMDNGLETWIMDNILALLSIDSCIYVSL